MHKSNTKSKKQQAKTKTIKITNIGNTCINKAQNKQNKQKQKQKHNKHKQK
jgi:hypothetical protein